MQAWRTIVLALALCLVSDISALAGVYSAADPDPQVLSPRYHEFQETLIKLRRMLNPDVPSPLRDNYQLIASLVPQNAAGLSWQQRLDLSACLIRLQKYQEAVEVLKPGATEDSKNFLIQSNLATAYQLLGLQDRAIDSISVALEEWPADESKLPAAQRQVLQRVGGGKKPPGWYRSVETYYKKLLRLRLRESLQAPAKAGLPPTSVDALFDDGGKPPRPVQFVGDSGKFEPGKLAAAEKAKLPEDAVEIVEQLLVWLPTDARLYWLLGELLNAHCDVASAEQIFDNLVTVEKVRFRDLLEHRQVMLARQRPTPGVTPPPPATTGDPDTTWSWQRWRDLEIGFGAGFLVALLGYWQVREIVRRRQQRAVSSRR